MVSPAPRVLAVIQVNGQTVRQMADFTRVVPVRYYAPYGGYPYGPGFYGGGYYRAYRR